MTLTAQQQRDITAQEFWADDGFAPIDTRGFPSLNPPPTDKHDDRFAKDWRDTPLTASAAKLRDFVQNPDTESLERIASETNQPDLVSEVRDRSAERVALQFKAARPSYIPCDDNLEKLVVTLAYNFLPGAPQSGNVNALMDQLQDAGVWSVQHLCAAFDKLHAEGLMVIPAGEPRHLTEAERLSVARFAQTGQVEQAINEYLSCALDGEELTLDLLHDPAYTPVCNDAVMAVFEEATLDYVSSPTRRAFLLRFAGNRPLTIALLREGWKACQRSEERHTRSEMLGVMQQPQEEEPPTAHDLDGLDDRQLDSLYHSTLYARNAQRRPGVLA